MVGLGILFYERVNRSRFWSMLHRLVSIFKLIDSTVLISLSSVYLFTMVWTVYFPRRVKQMMAWLKKKKEESLNVLLTRPRKNIFFGSNPFLSHLNNLNVSLYCISSVEDRRQVQNLSKRRAVGSPEINTGYCLILHFLH